jgi:hypothetical protein
LLPKRQYSFVRYCATALLSVTGITQFFAKGAVWV